MPFSEKTKIIKVSCGHNFGFFLSNQGLVYSFGEDNSDGQLGLGHIYPTEFPELIQCFRDIGERIDTIECGFRHAIAKSSLGKIYTCQSATCRVRKKALHPPHHPPLSLGSASVLAQTILSQASLAQAIVAQSSDFGKSHGSLLATMVAVGAMHQLYQTK